MKRLALLLCLAACDDGTVDTATVDAGPDKPDASPSPGEFWDPSGIPPAENVLVFKFLNRTNGAIADDHIFWRFAHDDIDELHSFAEQPLYDMPANSSGRMYFYVCPPSEPASCVDEPDKSPYFDFIEHTIGEDQYNGNTTRVDAFGLKLAMLLHSAEGEDLEVGEDRATFAESREATFAKYLDEVPDEFDHLGQPPFAPYRIVEPGRGEFGAEGLYADYYADFIDELWSANGITIAKAGSNGSGLADYRDLSAAIFRHVGTAPGTFTPDGRIVSEALWEDPSSFYTAAPANYYARFWHEHSIGGQAYGFPYDDVGSYSTYVSRKDPEYLLIAVGW